MIDLDAVGLRSYVAEPDRGRRDWSKEPEAQAPVYANRRRIRGDARPAPDASTGRADRTLLRASLRHRRDAPHASARPHEYPQAPADSCGRLQSRARHAPPDRDRHAARAAGSPGDRHRHAFGAPGRSPDAGSSRFPHGSHSWRLCAGFTSPITTAGNSSAAATYTTGCYGSGNPERPGNVTRDLIRVTEQCANGCAANGNIPGLVYRSQDWGNAYSGSYNWRASASYVTGGHSLQDRISGHPAHRRPHLFDQQPESGVPPEQRRPKPAHRTDLPVGEQFAGRAGTRCSRRNSGRSAG